MNKYKELEDALKVGLEARARAPVEASIVAGVLDQIQEHGSTTTQDSDLTFDAPPMRIRWFVLSLACGLAALMFVPATFELVSNADWGAVAIAFGQLGASTPPVERFLQLPVLLPLAVFAIFAWHLLEVLLGDIGT